MVGVFSIFGVLSLLMFKQFGVGLATAILLDATIVRAVLLPATMKLLGDRNWYLPRWLEWIPSLEGTRVRAGLRGPTGSVRRLGRSSRLLLRWEAGPFRRFSCRSRSTGSRALRTKPPAGAAPALISPP